METDSRVGLMKKKTKYIIYITLIILISLGAYKIIKKTKIENTYNSLVRIEAYDNDYISSGFGFVYKISKDKAYIITNYHVVEDYFNINIYDINNKKASAKLINYDINNDIAILSINNSLNLTEVIIGNSDSVKTNNKVYILGNPKRTKNFNSKNSGTIIETSEDVSDIYDFKPITISSSIDFGNSGGPVLDEKGRIIGIIVAMNKDNKDTCLAIPINYILSFVNENDINEDKPSLGAVMTNSSNISILNEYSIEPSNIDGVVILKLSNQSVLNKNNIKVGDIIISFNGVKIKNIDTLKKELYKLKTGYIVELEYYRNGSSNSITFKL